MGTGSKSIVPRYFHPTIFMRKLEIYLTFFKLDDLNISICNT